MPSKTLLDLDFPLYKMGKVENIYTNALGHKMVETFRGLYVLDDLNSKEEDYFLRRIQLKRKGYDVYHLSNKIDTFSNVFQYHSGTYFIDASGYVFKYKKGSKFYKIRCYKIDKKVFYPALGTLIFAQELTFPIYFSGKLHNSIKYMGVMDVDGGGLLYNLSELPFKEIRRKI